MNKVAQREEMLTHYGPLSYDEIGYLLNKMMAKFEAYSLALRKKVYMAMVESLENVYRHQDVMPDDTNHYPRFDLWVDDGQVEMSVGNPVLNSRVEHINACIERVNALDRDGLKELYKNIILHGTITEKGGAGLGFVNMAKVSDQKLAFTFDEIDAQYQYFTIKIVINHR